MIPSLAGFQLAFGEDLLSTFELELSDAGFREAWGALVEMEPVEVVTATPTPVPTEPPPSWAVVYHMLDGGWETLEVNGSQLPYSPGLADATSSAASADLMLARSLSADLLVAAVPREVNLTLLPASEVTASTSVWRRNQVCACMLPTLACTCSTRRLA